jgi:hypothetical protein
MFARVPSSNSLSFQVTKWKGFIMDEYKIAEVTFSQISEFHVDFGFSLASPSNKWSSIKMVGSPRKL